MDREKATEILKVYGKPTFKVGDNNIKFSRQTEENLSEIENKTNEELIEEWKSLVWVNCIYGQVSLNNLQRIDLIELEMSGREIDSEPLNKWYEKSIEEFDEQAFFDVDSDDGDILPF